MRQIILDTETTGLETSQDHRIIEIGGVEMINRKLTGRHYHQYINPRRSIDEGAMAVHGISEQFLADKPVFASVVKEFLGFIDGADLVIHNASFDIGFINHEIAKLDGVYAPVDEYCHVVDTLVMARAKHPGQKNNLNALCKRYGVDNSQRELHGALLDSEILADVYLLMSGGQVNLNINQQSGGSVRDADGSLAVMARRIAATRPPLRVIRASAEEQHRHTKKLASIQLASGRCLWLDDGD